MPSERSARTSSHAVRRAAGSKPVVGSSRKTSSGSPTSATPRSRRRFWPPDSVFTRASAFSRSPTSSITSSTSRGCAVVAGEHPVHLAHRERRRQLRVLQHDADPLAKGRARLPRDRRRARVTSPPSRGPIALEDLDRRRLAGAVRAEQAEHLARLARRSRCRAPPRRRRSACGARGRGSPQRRSRVEVAARPSPPAGSPGRARARRARSPSSPAGGRPWRRGRRRPRAPRAARRASRPARAAARSRSARRCADAIASAVWRARGAGSSARARAASGSAASRSPSARACSTPLRCSSRSSSGSPGAASAWRQR